MTPLLPPFSTFLDFNSAPVFLDSNGVLTRNINVQQIMQELTNRSPQGEMLRNEIRNQLKHTLSEIEIALLRSPNFKNDPQFCGIVINQWKEIGLQKGREILKNNQYHRMMFEALFQELVKPAIAFLLQRRGESVRIAVTSQSSIPYFFIDNHHSEPSLLCKVMTNQQGQPTAVDRHVMFLHLEQRSTVQSDHSTNNTATLILNSDSTNLNNNAAEIIKEIKNEEVLRHEIYNQLETAHIFIKFKQRISEQVIDDAIKTGIRNGCKSLVKKSRLMELFEFLFRPLLISVIDYFSQMPDKKSRVTVDKASPDPRFFIDLQCGIPSLFGEAITIRQERAKHHLMFLDFKINNAQSGHVPATPYTLSLTPFRRRDTAAPHQATPYQRPLSLLPLQTDKHVPHNNESIVRKLMGNHYDPTNDVATNLLSWMLINDVQLHPNPPIYLENLCFKLTEKMESDWKNMGSPPFWFKKNVRLQNCKWQCAATMSLENGNVWTDTPGARIYLVGQNAWAKALNGTLILQHGARGEVSGDGKMEYV